MAIYNICYIFQDASSVVIAIIAILAAMLLPALSKAREKARSISCVNSLKQVMLDMTMYLNDSNNIIPYYVNKGTLTTWSCILLGRAPLQADKSYYCSTIKQVTASDIRWNTYGILFPYEGAKESLPSAFRASATVDGVSFSCITYTPAKTPSATPILGDSTNAEGYNSWAIAGARVADAASQFTLGHGGNGNFACLDGHVESDNGSHFANYIKDIYKDNGVNNAPVYFRNQNLTVITR